MDRPAPPPGPAAVDVIRSAVDDFNRGNIEALMPQDGAPARRRPSCPDAALVAIDERPITITHMDGLEAQRVCCSLVTAHDSELVGIYDLADGRVARARHLFSDVDLLVRVGILRPGDLAGA
jgi:hypothetical protein